MWISRCGLIGLRGRVRCGIIGEFFSFAADDDEEGVLVVS
jgi:hypothetical protein